MTTFFDAARRFVVATRPYRAVLLIVLIAAVAVAAWFAGASAPSSQPSAPAPSVAPTGAVWPSPALPAASEEPGEDPNSASTAPAGPDVVEAAIDTAAHWLNAYPPMTAERWLYELRPLVTPQVAAALEGVDPAGTVPAGKVGVGTRGVMLDVGLAEVRVPIVSGSRTSPAPLGTLALQLVPGGGRWLVSSIDWAPA